MSSNSLCKYFNPHSCQRSDRKINQISLLFFNTFTKFLGQICLTTILFRTFLFTFQHFVHFFRCESPGIFMCTLHSHLLLHQFIITLISNSSIITHYSTITTAMVLLRQILVWHPCVLPYFCNDSPDNKIANYLFPDQ